MQFGLEKCEKGSFVKSKNITLDINMKYAEFEHNKTYWHFGINEANDINHNIKKKNMKIILQESKSHIKNRKECKK